MNILYDPLPCSIIVDGKWIEIDTDFRYYIEINVMMLDDDYDNESIFLKMIQLVIGDDNILYVLNHKESFIRAIQNYMKNNTTSTETSQESTENSDSGRNRRVLSYKQDAEYIISAFMECYHIDLIDIEYMHFYKFKALLNGLNENTELKQRMKYRSMDVSKIKDKNEKQRVIAIQRQIHIKQKKLSAEQFAMSFMD